MNHWMLLSVEVFVAAHFVALAYLLIKATMIRRRERAGRRLSRGRRVRDAVAA